MNSPIATKAINEELAALHVYRAQQVSGVDLEWIGRAERLITLIRSQPTYLVQWCEQYLKAASLLLWFYEQDGKSEQAIAEGVAILAEVEPADEIESAALLLRQIANNMIRSNRCEEALEHLHRAYQIHITYPISPTDMAAVSLSIGVACKCTRQMEMAVKWYLKTLSICQQALSIRHSQQKDLLNIMMYAYNNLCMMYSKMGENDKSIKYGQQGLEHMKAYGIESGYIYYPLGNAWLATQAFDKAIQSYQIGLEISIKLGDKFTQLHVLGGLGYVSIEKQQYDEGITYFMQALKIAEGVEHKPGIYQCCEQLAEAHSRNGDDTQALHYYKRYHEEYKAVFDETKQRNLEDLEVKHRTQIVQLESQQIQDDNETLERLIAARVVDLQESLEREAKLATQLADALRVTEKISTIRAEMIKTISHEFRTPLTIISTSSRLLHKNYDRFPPEKREKYFTNISDSVSNLSDMLQDVVQVEEIKYSPKADIAETISFGSICDQLTHVVNDEAAAQSPRLSVTQNGLPDRTIMLDLKLLTQAMMPIINNALTFSHEAVRITIVLTDKLTITIKDRGVGITEDEMPYIFDLFYRSPRSEFQRGIGLGLYTAQHLVSMMGGVITAESKGIGQGTTLTITLPASGE